MTAFRTVDVVLGALAGIIPDRVPAAGDSGNSLVIIGDTGLELGSVMFIMN